MSTRIVHYFDYKSPYAFLAQGPVRALAQRAKAELVLVPYTLDIPAYLGSARTDERGVVLEEQRNAHQWRRVRYAYMDCRREANRLGLTIRGPRKIFDSDLSHLGFLWLAGEPVIQQRYHDTVFERFWRRELDIEDPGTIAAVARDAGGPQTGFEAFANGAGRLRLHDLRVEAEAAGVFGVPSYRIAGQLYWGGERLERVAEHLGLPPVSSD